MLFEGEVQGVGFRATTAGFARRLAIAGTVRNLVDGRVELIAEGERPEIDRLIDQLREHFGAKIQHLDQSTAAATGEPRGFQITG